jgi:hypothetical protein
LIRYELTCSQAHDFEGWFRNSADFEAQTKKSLVTCPVCGCHEIEKKLMAPAVSTARGRAAMVASDTGEQAAPADQGQDNAGAEAIVQRAALVPEEPKQKEMLNALRELRKQMIASSDDVGEQFPEEARRMHYGESEQRSIHGQTSVEEAKSLIDEGIDILPLPVLPDEKN